MSGWAAILPTLFKKQERKSDHHEGSVWRLGFQNGRHYVEFDQDQYQQLVSCGGIVELRGQDLSNKLIGIVYRNMTFDFIGLNPVVN